MAWQRSIKANYQQTAALAIAIFLDGDSETDSVTKRLDLTVVLSKKSWLYGSEASVLNIDVMLSMMMMMITPRRVISMFVTCKLDLHDKFLIFDCIVAEWRARRSNMDQSSGRCLQQVLKECALEQRCSQNIVRVEYHHQVSNSEVSLLVFGKVDSPSEDQRVILHRLRWSRHVFRMEEDILPYRVLFIALYEMKRTNRRSVHDFATNQ
ncbi:hypothetical protein T265_02925 [Opisthorchis viverrini]|uniref:Uncharacterized protein n=1 Tax=Opisthorchis viverrini TaxID=6198 RepID=A0A075A542_OPIVI|nr:hypothetical protein T265_02925 [Opisthorchis viverrini]KER30685.1 hypothetical protein T265_02925 [Opisthorchis viverrini]